RRWPGISFPVHWKVGPSVQQILQYLQHLRFKPLWFSKVFLHNYCVLSNNLRKEFRTIGLVVPPRSVYQQTIKIIEMLSF
ncbi:MAG: hypothetical protein ACO20N_16490, partial [bacterium]